ncbi:MAG: hypothetical protein IH591_03395 [Bacteroidales bacterium]|nr:hypothetical protein [Bacteroidales bacterium]
MNKITMTSILLLGAAGITLAGINWHNGLAAWIGPTLLLYYTRNTQWINFIVFFPVVAVSGIISQTGNNLFNIFSINLINGILFAVLTCISYFSDKLLYKRDRGFIFTLIFPATVVIVEYFVSLKIGTWGVVAHTQYAFKPLTQLSALTGLYGISFMVTWFASVVNWIWERKDDTASVRLGAIIYSIVFVSILCFGLVTRNFASNNNNSVKVSCIISETDVHKLAFDNKESFQIISQNGLGEVPANIFSTNSIIDSLIFRTRKASSSGAKIIVWNELALILTQAQKEDLILRLAEICDRSDIYLLFTYLEYKPSENLKPFYNSCCFLDTEGKIAWEYHKSFLHPYAEVPIINEGGYIIPFIDTEYGRIGSAICADLDMPKLISQAGKESINLMLVPAYDWKGINPLHSQMACISGMQYGFAVIRPNGKGLSAIYDNNGKEISRSDTFKSNDKIIVAELPLDPKATLYSASGDILVYVCMSFLMITAVLRILNLLVARAKMKKS